MKELSIEQKAKRYDEAIERAKAYHNDYTQDIMEDIFPELKESEESEGEKIREKLIDTFNFYDSAMNSPYLLGIHRNDIVAWLEKQGDDKVEQKFKIGDWVVFNNKHQSIYQVEKIEDGYYILRHTHGGTFRVCVLHDESLRPWTIQDAKDGDVLACNEEILLFKSYSVQGRISLYCWYNGQTNNFHSKEVVDTLMTTRNKICPATKEQRDTLMKAMADAGYTFDFEKKKLKKIEGESVWSEEDEKLYKSALWHIKNSCGNEGKNSGEFEVYNWFKSLKERYVWKPSDEQMAALWNVCQGGKEQAELATLYNDLKKLKG